VYTVSSTGKKLGGGGGDRGGGGNGGGGGGGEGGDDSSHGSANEVTVPSEYALNALHSHVSSLLYS